MPLLTVGGARRYDQMKGYLISTKIGIFKDGLINHFVCVSFSHSMCCIY